MKRLLGIVSDKGDMVKRLYFTEFLNLSQKIIKSKKCFKFQKNKYILPYKKSVSSYFGNFYLLNYQVFLTHQILNLIKKKWFSTMKNYNLLMNKKNLLTGN